MAELMRASSLYEIARSGATARYRYLEASAELAAWSGSTQWPLSVLAAVTALLANRAELEHAGWAVMRYMLTRQLCVCQTLKATVPFKGVSDVCAEAERIGLRPESSRLWYVRHGLAYAIQAVEMEASPVRDADDTTAADLARTKAEASGVRYLAPGYRATTPGDIWVAGVGDIATTTAWSTYGLLEQWEQGRTVEGPRCAPLYRGLLGDRDAVPLDVPLFEALGVTSAGYDSALLHELMSSVRARVRETASLLSGYGEADRVDVPSRDLMGTIEHLGIAPQLCVPGSPFDFPTPGRGEWTLLETQAAIHHGMTVRRVLRKRHPTSVMAEMFLLPEPQQIPRASLKRNTWSRRA